MRRLAHNFLIVILISRSQEKVINLKNVTFQFNGIPTALELAAENNINANINDGDEIKDDEKVEKQNTSTKLIHSSILYSTPQLDNKLETNMITDKNTSGRRRNFSAESMNTTTIVRTLEEELKNKENLERKSMEDDIEFKQKDISATDVTKLSINVLENDSKKEFKEGYQSRRANPEEHVEKELTKTINEIMKEDYDKKLTNNVYVPISEDMANPQLIPEFLMKPIAKDGLPLMDLKGSGIFIFH